MKRYSTQDVLDGFHAIPVHRTLIAVTLIVCATAIICTWSVASIISKEAPKLLKNQDYFVVQNHAGRGGGVIIVDGFLDTVTLCRPKYIDKFSRYDMTCQVPISTEPEPLDFSDRALPAFPPTD